MTPTWGSLADPLFGMFLGDPFSSGKKKLSPKGILKGLMVVGEGGREGIFKAALGLMSASDFLHAWMPSLQLAFHSCKECCWDYFGFIQATGLKYWHLALVDLSLQ